MKKDNASSSYYQREGNPEDIDSCFIIGVGSLQAFIRHTLRKKKFMKRLMKQRPGTSFKARQTTRRPEINRVKQL